MISMLSQVSSSQDRASSYRGECPSARKANGMLTTMGAAVAIAACLLAVGSLNGQLSKAPVASALSVQSHLNG